jgi:hypothetical protein
MIAAEQNTSTGNWFGSLIDKYGELGKTILIVAAVLTFIINGIVMGLYCFGLVQLPSGLATVFGIVSFGFAAWMLGMMVVSGVQYKISGNKRRK